MSNEKREGLNRREFLRKAAITGAAAWAVPVIQTVAASPAAAGTPFCDHSACSSACIEWVNAQDPGNTERINACQAHCWTVCRPGSPCDPSFCQPPFPV